LTEVNEEGAIWLEMAEVALADDLNTSSVLATIWDMSSAEVSASQKLAVLLKLDTILSLGIQEHVDEKLEIPAEVQALLEQRQAAREAKDWALSDQLRETIEKAGFQVKDGQNNTQELVSNS